MKNKSEGATKYDGGKLRMDLIPREVFIALATVLGFGANKYSDYDWASGMDWSRSYSALLRHLTAWWDGDGIDEETGESHLWHAMCCLTFLIVYEARGIGKDDRFVK